MIEEKEDNGPTSLKDELNELIIRKKAENKLLHKLRDALLGEVAVSPEDISENNEPTEIESDKSITEY